jgi:hypothetical protein
MTIARRYVVQTPYQWCLALRRYGYANINDLCADQNKIDFFSADNFFNKNPISLGMISESPEGKRIMHCG